MNFLNTLKTNLQIDVGAYSNFGKIFFILSSFLILAGPLFSQDTTQVAPTPAYDPLLAKLQKALTPDGKGNITFTPGLRIQTRYDLENDNGDRNNDFYINRLRLKGGGKVFDVAKYYFEVKIDGSGKFNKTPTAQVENAWMDFKIKDALIIRAGLYDMVFSRNALTSDSKLLLMDRSLIKDALTVLGIADNTVGILVHGRPMDGHLSYGAGIFDNLGFEIQGKDSTIIARKSDGAMVTGRLGYDFLDPASPGGYGDYQSSYLGEGRRLTLNANVGYLSKAQIGTREFALTAYGVDLFFNMGGFVFEAEYDAYMEKNSKAGDIIIDGSGWYVQAGYLVFPKLEVAVRYQELDPDTNNSFGLGDVINTAVQKKMWTTIGINYYIRGHNLKVQAEYTIRKEEVEVNDNDLLQVQLQLDF